MYEVDIFYPANLALPPLPPLFLKKKKQKKHPFRNLNQVGKEVGRKEKVLQLTGPN